MAQRRYDHSLKADFRKNCIKDEALDLDVDESKVMYCPFCDNAPPYQPSMSITRVDSGILYHCFRAGCGESGHLGSIPSSMMKKEKVEDFTSKPFTHPTRNLTVEEMQFLSGKYDLTVEEIEDNEIKWMRDKKGICMPLYTRSGSKFGYCTKYWETQQYKSILYKQANYPNLHWAYAGNMDPYGWGTLVLVEDIISAIRVSRFAQGVALLGTDIDSDKALALSEASPHHVIYALDPDATGKAAMLQREFNLFFKSSRVAALSCDPKDMDHDQLQQELDL